MNWILIVILNLLIAAGCIYISRNLEFVIKSCKTERRYKKYRKIMKR